MNKNDRLIPLWNTDAKPDVNNPNSAFCMAPWTHTYISPQSERRLCCASREEHSFQKQYIDSSNDSKYGKMSDSKVDLSDYTPVSLKEHWNSEYMRNIRVTLMRGEQIPQCDVCNKNLLMEGDSYRGWFTGVLFRDKIQEAFDSTDDTGYTTMEPISFDYRFSNLCNFKCRMCGEQLSSSWETEKRLNNMWTPKNQPFMVPEIKKAMNQFQKDVVEPEFRDAIARGIVEEIYWVGGEPLMYDVHWWALDEMMRNGSASNCYLRYNSNLSRIQFGDKNLYSYLPHFKNWIMCASIDGTGDIVEYIRTGIKWEQWLHNFKQGLALPGGNKRMKLDLTITAPGMFSLKELFDLSLELDVEIITKITFAFHADIMWTPLSWPRDILNDVVDDILAYCVPRANHNHRSFISNLNALKDSRKTHQEEWPETYKVSRLNGKRWVENLEKIRIDTTLTMRDIYSTSPALLAWWDSIE
jgi:hypothetical protein